MDLHNLPKTTAKGKKRVGRGYGSGKGGHTVGRGHKGQKSRSKVGLIFEGTKFRKSTLRRLPMLRGKGKFKSKQGPIIVNVKYLNLLPPKTLVTSKSLAKHNVVDATQSSKFGVKILGEGELKIPLKVALPCSKSAAGKIKKAGGEIVKLKIRNEKLEMKKEQKKRAEKEKSAKIPQKSVKSKDSIKTTRVKKQKAKDE